METDVDIIEARKRIRQGTRFGVGCLAVGVTMAVVEVANEGTQFGLLLHGLPWAMGLGRLTADFFYRRAIRQVD